MSNLESSNHLAQPGRRSLRLPRELICAIKGQQMPPSRLILTISVAAQSMRLFEKIEDRARRQVPSLRATGSSFPQYRLRKEYLVSTSAYGIGQVVDSQQTPCGLHRVARKIGGGHPIGTVFRNRKVTGFTWQGLPDASIVHRIFWLEGLEPGRNRGGKVDTFSRYIYIHGFGDETTLGRPASHGCIHLAARDLIPLYDLLPVGSLVWIAER